MQDTIQTLVGNLSSRDHAACSAAQDALIALGPAAIDQLLPHMLDRSAGSPRRSVQFVIGRMGDEVLPRLREIRSEGPGRLRGSALEMLVELGGADALDERDRRAVERLVRIKILDERPVETPSEGGRWLAFPADRLDDAVAALGLHDVRPATSVMGVAAATQAADSLEFRDADGGKHRAYRVFITPEFSGWRLLFGNSFLDELGGTNLADKVSEQAGEAHFYAIDTYHSSQLWWLARDGHVVRGHSTYSEPEFVGDPLPFELEYMEGEDDPFADPYFVEKYAKGVTDADMAADALSVMPGPMPESTTHGHGWLATTHAEARNSRFKGVLPI
ncbi:hypothetical protein [Streptomyces sp. NPDC057403]|uniref:hypothetical protein n=1 Tax=Streptomyces sp. NPDC057403 TaxID=3346119 RepID=UPI0036BC2F8A